MRLARTSISDISYKSVISEEARLFLRAASPRTEHARQTWSSGRGGAERTAARTFRHSSKEVLHPL